MRQAHPSRLAALYDRPWGGFVIGLALLALLMTGVAVMVGVEALYWLLAGAA